MSAIPFWFFSDLQSQTTFAKLNSPFSDNSKDNLTFAITKRLDASEYFEFYKSVNTQAEAEKLLRRGEVKLIVVYEPNIESNAVRNMPARIDIICDASDPNESSYLSNYVNAFASAECVERFGVRVKIPQIQTKVNIAIQSAIKECIRLYPGVMGLILFLICTLMIR